MPHVIACIDVNKGATEIKTILRATHPLLRSDKTPTFTRRCKFGNVDGYLCRTNTDTQSVDKSSDN